MRFEAENGSFMDLYSSVEFDSRIQDFVMNINYENFDMYALEQMMEHNDFNMRTIYHYLPYISHFGQDYKLHNMVMEASNLFDSLPCGYENEPISIERPTPDCVSPTYVRVLEQFYKFDMHMLDNFPMTQIEEEILPMVVQVLDSEHGQMMKMMAQQKMEEMMMEQEEEPMYEDDMHMGDDMNMNSTDYYMGHVEERDSMHQCSACPHFYSMGHGRAWHSYFFLSIGDRSFRPVWLSEEDRSHWDMEADMYSQLMYPTDPVDPYPSDTPYNPYPSDTPDTPYNPYTPGEGHQTPEQPCHGNGASGETHATFNINFNGLPLMMEKKEDGHYDAHYMEGSQKPEMEMEMSDIEMSEMPMEEVQKPAMPSFEESTMQSMMLSTLLLKLEDMEAKAAERMMALEAKLDTIQCSGAVAPVTEPETGVVEEQPSGETQTGSEPETGPVVEEEEEEAGDNTQAIRDHINNIDVLKASIGAFSDVAVWDAPKVFEELENCAIQALRNRYNGNANRAKINAVFTHTDSASFDSIESLINGYNPATETWQVPALTKQCSNEITAAANSANNQYAAVKTTPYQCGVYFEKIFHAGMQSFA